MAGTASRQHPNWWVLASVVPGDYTKHLLTVHWLPIIFCLFTKAHFLLIVSCCLVHFTHWRGAYIALPTASKQQKATWTLSGSQASRGSENTICLKCTGNKCTDIPQRYEAAQLRWPAMADFNCEKDPELWPDQPKHDSTAGAKIPGMAWPTAQPGPWCGRPCCHPACPFCPRLQAGPCTPAVGHSQQAPCWAPPAPQSQAQGAELKENW